jgi:hypothetical protein
MVSFPSSGVSTNTQVQLYAKPERNDKSLSPTGNGNVTASTAWITNAYDVLPTMVTVRFPTTVRIR